MAHICALGGLKTKLWVVSNLYNSHKVRQWTIPTLQVLTGRNGSYWPDNRNLISSIGSNFKMPKRGNNC